VQRARSSYWPNGTGDHGSLRGIRGGDDIVGHILD
jgi:hypothetical protein